MTLQKDSLERLAPLLQHIGGETETVFGLVHDSLREGVVCCDIEGRVLYCNKGFEEVTGYALADISGRRVYEFLFSSDADDLVERAALQHRRYVDRVEGRSEEYDLLITTKSGAKREIEVKASPLRLGDGSIVGSIGVILDVTERRMMEQQLLWSQKMEAVGRLAGSVAHDFNNLLTVISGYASVLIKRAGPSPMERKPIEAIAHATAVACTLTQQLLAVSKRQVVQPRVVDLSDSLYHSSGLLRGLLGYGISLQTEYSREPLPILFDAGQLEQVIMNLVVNARDAMPNGGVLRIETHHQVLQEPLAAISGSVPPGRYCVLTVSDTGQGIPPSIQKHLFEPFFTTKREGTGLGLSTVFGIMQQCRGHIRFTSVIGEGTSFILYFPQANAIADIAAEPQQLKESSQQRIHVVEDESSVRLLIEDVLSGYGYVVTSSEDAPTALAYLTANADNLPDLLVTDITLPGMDGVELVRQLQEKNISIEVLAMSGATISEQVAKRVQGLRIPFLAKPFSPEALVARIQEQLPPKE